MSGHSKWATTKRKKAKTDVARAKAWNKLIKEISIAAKLGGGNPDANPRLRAAILKSKSQSLPTKNIESAIAKGTGANSGTEMTEPMYEGRGPGGIAIMVQCMTDNKVRTVAEIRNIFNKNNGSMGESGSVSWAFTYKGVIIVDAEKYPEDQVMDLVLEASIRRRFQGSRSCEHRNDERRTQLRRQRPGQARSRRRREAPQAYRQVRRPRRCAGSLPQRRD